MPFQLRVNAHFNVGVQFHVLILEKCKTPWDSGQENEPNVCFNAVHTQVLHRNIVRAIRVWLLLPSKLWNQLKHYKWKWLWSFWKFHINAFIKATNTKYSAEFYKEANHDIYTIHTSSEIAVSIKTNHYIEGSQFWVCKGPSLNHKHLLMLKIVTGAMSSLQK